MIRPLITLSVILSVVYFANADDLKRKIGIQQHPDAPKDRGLSQITLFDPERVTIDVLPSSDSSRALLLVRHVFDPTIEKGIELQNLEDVQDATIHGNRPDGVGGFSYPRLSIQFRIYEVDFDDGITMIELSESSFKNMPSYFPYQLPFVVKKPLTKDKKR